MPNRIFFHSVLQMLVLCFLAAACVPETGKPTVMIESPPHGSQYHEGEEVAVQSTSVDPTGVTHVELVVDGITVHTVTVPGTLGQLSFTCIQTWQATQGTHMVSVHAHNAAGVASEPASVSISVLPAVPLGVTPTTTPTPSLTPRISPSPSPTISPTSSPTPSRTPLSSGPGACTDDAAFVVDVTVPDDTVIGAGQVFNKIWRIRNSGKCAWGTGYQFVFVGGNAMSGVTRVAVPDTPPGATADLLVSMIAPTVPGSYAGQWRMRSPGGVLFGATVSVRINVPSSPPPPAPTALTAPNGFGATGTGTTIAFTWTDNSINEAGFRIYQTDQVAPVVTIDAHTGTGGMAYNWTDRPCNVDAAFTIRAFNPAGESEASGTSATVTVPCAPGFAAENATPMGSLYINLTDNSTNESGFRIYRSDSATPVATLAARPGVGIKGATAIGPFPCGSRASFYARAYNSAGESASSSTSEGVMLKCQVGVTFTSVDIISSALSKPGLAHIRLKFTVNSQVQYWPSPTDYQEVNIGDTKTLNIMYSFLLMRDMNLDLKVEGIEYEYNPSIQQPVQSDLGVVEKTYTGAGDWGKGSHADESTHVNGAYRLHYTISVTP